MRLPRKKPARKPNAMNRVPMHVLEERMFPFLNNASVARLGLVSRRFRPGVGRSLNARFENRQRETELIASAIRNVSPLCFQGPNVCKRALEQQPGIVSVEIDRHRRYWGPDAHRDNIRYFEVVAHTPRFTFFTTFERRREMQQHQTRWMTVWYIFDRKHADVVRKHRYHMFREPLYSLVPSYSLYYDTWHPTPKFGAMHRTQTLGAANSRAFDVLVGIRRSTRRKRTR